MSNGSNIKSETLLCTVCGMALALIADINSQDILRTVLHAAVGATVSFIVTLFLKWVIEKIRN